MIHINARSVIKNMSNITNYLHTIIHKFKIIVITESWLNKDNYHLYNINNYNSVHTYRVNARGGGGSIYLSEEISYTKINDLSNSILREFDMLSVSVILNNKASIISGIYKSPKFNMITSQIHYILYFTNIQNISIYTYVEILI